jgi:hypothetical protein
MDVERNARAQVVYRDSNGRIRELDEAFLDHGRIEVMCECGRGCTERLEVRWTNTTGLDANQPISSSRLPISPARSIA